MSSTPEPRNQSLDPVSICDHDGVRYLQFETEWVQGAMRFSRLDWLELEYVRRMIIPALFVPSPARVCLMGLGAGSLTRFFRKRFAQTSLDIVEINPDVVEVCREHFALPADGPLQRIHLADADAWARDPSNHGLFDMVLVDVFDAQARGPVLDSPEFYKGCHDCLAPGGVMAANLFGDPSASRIKNSRSIRSAFEHALFLPEAPSGNVIAIAGNSPLSLDPWGMASIAADIQSRSGLPTERWLDLLRASTPE